APPPSEADPSSRVVASRPPVGAAARRPAATPPPRGPARPLPPAPAAARPWHAAAGGRPATLRLAAARRVATLPPRRLLPRRARTLERPEYDTAGLRNVEDLPDMSRLAAVVATLLAVVLLGAAVWAQAPRDVVVVGMEAEPPGLDPGQALGLHTLRVTAEIFETLVATPDDSTDVIPGLAESWTTSS